MIPTDVCKDLANVLRRDWRNGIMVLQPTFFHGVCKTSLLGTAKWFTVNNKYCEAACRHYIFPEHPKTSQDTEGRSSREPYPKLSFPQNFHTKKLGEISVF